MDIGGKIKQLRLSKMMTQSDLAGEQITRNMLSSIEHGTALPSLQTAAYLAERLSVPIGFLLAGEEESFFYRKMMSMPNIRRAFAAGDHIGCLSLIAGLGEELDDELLLLRAECEYGRGHTALLQGRLRLAAAVFDRALISAAQTVYDTAWLRARIAVCFRYLASLSPTLVSDVLDAEEIECARASGEIVCDYFSAVECGERAVMERFLARYPDSLFAQRLQALLLLKSGAYTAAVAEYERLLAREDLTLGVLMYEVFGDMEQCCRESDDYKRAYEFGNSRIELLERFLEEV